jgi:hypothetical protein
VNSALRQAQDDNGLALVASYGRELPLVGQLLPAAVNSLRSVRLRSV